MVDNTNKPIWKVDEVVILAMKVGGLQIWQHVKFHGIGAVSKVHGFAFESDQVEDQVICEVLGFVAFGAWYGC